MLTNVYRVENRHHDADDLLGAETGDSRVEEHRRAIEPWLSAIFQSEHLNLLIGSGFGTGLAGVANATAASMAAVSIDPAFDVRITAAAGESAAEMGRGAPNVEDQFRAALALLGGLGILDDSRKAALKSGLDRALSVFANGVIRMERGIVDIADVEAEKLVLRLLTEFLLSFASRTASRDRLHIFTTNYDRLIEYGFDLIGVRTIDRFVGALEPRFLASRFDVDIHYTPLGGRSDARPLEGVVRLTKLHGSIDWRARDGNIVREPMPFGGSREVTEEDAERLMIFPNAAKDIETAFYPYAELFRDFSAATCRPNSALVTYGYGFGDDHVNRVIRDMLTLPSTHLVVISFDGASGRIQRFLDRCGRPAQVSMIVGPQLAALQPLVDHYLPKPAIDSITQRETELLERRRRPADGTSRAV